jgi:predicted TIM-barrel fold metal-dependent hydrolase
MIIDAHSHGVHDDYIDRLASAGGEWFNKSLNRLLGPRRERMPCAHHVALRLEQLDRNGIAMQVVTPIPTLDSNFCPGDVKAKLAYSAIMNDGMAKLMEDSKGRLLACGTIPLEGFETGGWQEMKRAVEILGMKAMSVPTHVSGKALDLPAFESFWDRATELKVPIYIHPQDPVGFSDRRYEADYRLFHNLGWPYEPELALSRLVFSGMMERHPLLKVVSHHLGGGLPFLMGRTIEAYGEPSQQEKMLGRVLPGDLFEYFSRFYYDTAVGGSAPAIRCAYEIFGVGQLVFATDAPFGPGGGEERLASYPKVIRSLGLSEEENKKIFFDNARKLFNLE